MTSYISTTLLIPCHTSSSEKTCWGEDVCGYIVLVRTSRVSLITQAIDSLMNTLTLKCSVFFKWEWDYPLFLFVYFFNSHVSIIALYVVLDRDIFHMLRWSDTKVILSITCSFNNNKGMRIVFRVKAFCPSLRISKIL